MWGGPRLTIAMKCRNSHNQLVQMHQTDSFVDPPTDSTKVCGMVAAEKMGNDGRRGRLPRWDRL